MNTKRRYLIPLMMLAAMVMAASGVLAAKREPPPQTSAEGLQLRPSKDNRIVYVRPGATFGNYRRVFILDPYVEFKKDWQRNYNESAVGLEGRVRDEDMARIKAELAKDLKSVFSQVLEEGSDFEIADTEAEGVLVLRPAIVNLDVTAPDLQRANTTAIVASVGEMTLYLELWDASTDQILARVMDREVDDGFAERADRSSNRFAARSTLKAWATELRKHLDAARHASGT